MKKMQKMIALIIMVTLILGVVGVLPIQNVSADTLYTEIQPQIMNDLSNFGSEAKPVWTVSEFKPDYGVVQHYAKFTLAEKSIIAVKCAFADQGTHETSAWCYISTLPDVSTTIASCTDGGSTDWEVLEAGTYYVKLESGLGNLCMHSVNVYLGAIPASKSMKFTEKKVSNGKQSKVTFTDFIKNTDDYDCKIYKGAATKENHGNSIQYLYRENSFTVDKNGIYTICITFDSYNLYESLEYWHTFEVTGVDETKPTVKGIKNGAAYKKKATIYAKDANGIQQIKAGSKKIKLTKVKSGKYKGYSKAVITKKGKYTIKVYDKAGNVKTIKITIK